ncbi:MAG: hypothetical protein RL748_3542, partial [Pseudomonadota bacterium]
MQATKTAHPTRPSLLLVDDQAANLHALAAILKADYDLQFATHGERALQLAHGNPAPDLILLDVVMPDISGMEVLRRLRADVRSVNIPVILVSGESAEQNECSGLDLGADDYLSKPVQPYSLLARVRNILLRKAGEQQLRLASHMFEHSSEAMLILRADHSVYQVNPAFIHLTGFSAQDMLGQQASPLALDHSGQALSPAWQALVQQDAWRGEIWNRRKDGTLFPALLSLSCLRTSQGEVEFYFASLVD